MVDKAPTNIGALAIGSQETWRRRAELVAPESDTPCQLILKRFCRASF